MRSSTLDLTVFALLLSTILVAPAGAQQSAVVTAADYDRAVTFLPQNVAGLVVGGAVTAHWLEGDRFWYRNPLADGAELILVDPVKRTRARAFDHDKLATALSAAAGARYDALHLPLESIDLSNDATSLTFQIETKRWSCKPQAGTCAEAPGKPSTLTSSDEKPLTMAPDGIHGAFIRDWNLWVRDVVKGEERQLTTDGAAYFGYATDNAGWKSSDRAMVQWSPDSTKIATQQQDEREVGEMYLVNTTVGHPTLRVSKFPLPGDVTMPMLHRVIIDVASARVTRLQMPADFHRATLGDDIRMADYNWSPDATTLALASVSRDHKQVVLRVADASTGAVRTVLEETVATQFESRGWDIDWSSKAVIWFSERDNWGQLYLYDLTTGQLKNQITTGAGPVTQLTRLDEKSRTIWFAANGREGSQDPYFRHFYRVGVDGTHAVSLTPDDGDHAMQLSPSGRYLIDTYSKPDTPPVVVLRGHDGEIVMPIEKADISRLVATGWKPPMPITMTAHDGTTAIYGLLFRPTTFDPSKKYPIVNNVYPGPQTGSTGSRSFSAARGDRQALAELGFIVVTIDGMGTPGRSKKFQDAYYGAMGRDNTIPDQIAAMKELAQKYPWIDLTRAGIWGHSGGGFATSTAMFRFPGVFKVGIAESGNHDQRENEDDWGERYQGLLTKGADGVDNYDAEANQNFAKNLQGHLLLAHGTMDTNVPPYETLLVADALIKANKDFDLLLLPNQNHGYGNASSYMTRRRWDYFVKWLLETEPPKQYEIKTR